MNWEGYASPHVYPQPFKVYYGAVSKFGHHESHSLGHLIIIPCYPQFWDKPDKPSMKRHMIFRMFPQKSSKLLKWMILFGKGWSHSPLRILAWSETAWRFSNGDGHSAMTELFMVHILWRNPIPQVATSRRNDGWHWGNYPKIAQHFGSVNYYSLISPCPDIVGYWWDNYMDWDNSGRIVDGYGTTWDNYSWVYTSRTEWLNR